MKDVKIALEELKEESESGHLASHALAGTSRPRVAWIAAAGAALVLILAAALLFLRRWTEPRMNPLDNAQFTRLTNFEGAEAEAVISADGKFIAFLSDRDGPIDVWIGQVGSSHFTNLTKGRFPGLTLLSDSGVRPLAFSPDSTQISLRDGDTT